MNGSIDGAGLSVKRQHWQHRQRMATLLMALALVAGCATGSDPARPGPAVGNLPAESARISDEQVNRDQGVYRETQDRIAKLNASGQRRVADYHLAKAQCWLDVSFHEYTRNDRGGFPPAALRESQRLIAAMEGGSDPGWETPLVNQAQRLRADLWARHQALRGHAGFGCAAQRSACAEVELVHAGNEIRQGGWRNAKPYIQIAEDMTGEAEAAARDCRDKTAEGAETEGKADRTDASRPAAAPVAAAVAAAAVTERIELAADALFRFDRHERDQILPDGERRVAELAQQIVAGFARIDSLTVVGHTDRLGADSYNDRLSLQRAQTVRDLIARVGVKVPVGAYGMGRRQPVRQCADTLARAALIACLQPNRRVIVEVVGVRR